MSARYEVKRSYWYPKDADGIEIAHEPVILEIYYHKPHTFNLDNMMDGMKASLDYYTQAFGPYKYSILRIAEFPRFATFAQAFPTLIPFSESAGFIANISEKTIDYPFYITAHEVAHQWWAHQLIGGFTRGTIMLSESFTEYSSLMVVKQHFSDKLFRELLAYNMSHYLMGRSGESRHELPLTQSEVHQPYVAYNKGLLVMNAASRLLGEEVLNLALREFLEKYRFTANPYPTSLDFMAILDNHVPDSLKTTIDDMFNKVVLYDHKITNVETDLLDDGDYNIAVSFTTEKVYYDEVGVPDRVEYEGWIEIGFTDTSGEIYHLVKVPVTGKENRYEFTHMIKPNQIILNPYFITLDLSPWENIHGGSLGNRSISVQVEVQAN